MAIRGTKKECYKVRQSMFDVKTNILQSLQLAGFKNIEDNNFLNQIKASYKSFTTVGYIIITMSEENGYVCIEAEATANMDNIYALFSSPTQKILNKFKEYLKYR